MSIFAGIDGVSKEVANVLTCENGIIREATYGITAEGGVLYPYYGNPFDLGIGIAIKPYTRYINKRTETGWAQEGSSFSIPYGTSGEDLGEVGEWHLTNSGSVYIKPNDGYMIYVYFSMFMIYSPSSSFPPGFGAYLSRLLTTRQKGVSASGEIYTPSNGVGNGTYTSKLFNTNLISSMPVNKWVSFDMTITPTTYRATDLQLGYGVYNGRVGGFEFRFTSLAIDGKNFPITWVGAPSE